MEKNYVEIQGHFSDSGKFVGTTYVPKVINRLMDETYALIGQAGQGENLVRLRVTVEIEDMGAEVKFGKPVPSQNIDPAPEVVF